MKIVFLKQRNKRRYNVFTHKDELGEIFFHTKWKKWVWEQNQDIIMSRGCLEKVIKFMEEELGGKK